MPKKAMENLTESMFYVLMAFLHGDMCGIDIADFVEKKTGGAVSMGPATLYTILGKFEKEKYIKLVKEVGRKRTYRLTEKGRKAYEEELARLRRCIVDAESEGQL